MWVVPYGTAGTVAVWVEEAEGKAAVEAPGQSAAGCRPGAEDGSAGAGVGLGIAPSEGEDAGIVPAGAELAVAAWAEQSWSEDLSLLVDCLKMAPDDEGLWKDHVG